MYMLDGTETQRLYFRKITASDYDHWLPFHQDPRSSRYWYGLPADPDVACKEQFERIFERYDKGLGGMNGLILRSNGKLIGMSGLLVQSVDGMEELEIGYSIVPEYWRQGYAAEAALHCKELAFSRAYAPSLISIIHKDNLPSRKVALKNDMFLDKTTRYRDNPVDIFRVYSPGDQGGPDYL